MTSTSHRPVQAVLFDLDGTLIDTALDFATVLNRMRRDHGLESLPFPAIRAVVSDGARALVRLGFGVAEGEDGFDTLREELLARYEHHLADQSALFPGMETVLEWLEQRQLMWGIVTNKPVRYAAPLIEALGLTERCGALICPDHVQQRKPDPEGLLMACRQLGSDPAATIYVGDHRRDIEAGRHAGMFTVGCRYGYLKDPLEFDLWGADLVITEARELIDWLAPRMDCGGQSEHLSPPPALREMPQ